MQHHGEKTGEQAKESWLKRCEKDRQEEEQKKITQIRRATFIKLDEVSHPGEFLALFFFLNSV